MVIQIVMDLLILLAWILYFYAVYKVIWYIVKMFSFRAKMRKLGKEEGIRVEELRGLRGILLGTKGEADYYVTVKGIRYEVSVISFISVHGRWSFEKTRIGHLIEVRRPPEFFYSKKRHLSVADSVHERKNELRLSRKALVLTPKEDEYAMQILLVYPAPMRITYADHQYTEIHSGDTVTNHVIMNIQDFLALVRSAAAAP